MMPCMKLTHDDIQMTLVYLNGDLLVEGEDYAFVGPTKVRDKPKDLYETDHCGGIMFDFMIKHNDRVDIVQFTALGPRRWVGKICPTDVPRYPSRTTFWWEQLSWTLSDGPSAGIYPELIYSKALPLLLLQVGHILALAFNGSVPTNALCVGQ